jgi:hypothetical protein
MRKTKKHLLDRSLTWIRTHLHAKNLDVPGEFLSEWIILEDDDAEVRPTGFYLSVFTFGYMQHELLCGTLPPTVARSVSIKQLIDLFGRWQVKLALAEVHRRTDIHVDALPLFEFPDGEEIRYRPGDINAKAETSE